MHNLFNSHFTFPSQHLLLSNYTNKINSMKRTSDKLIIVEKDKRAKNLNIPIYIDKAIPNLTKCVMDDFFLQCCYKELIKGRI